MEHEDTRIFVDDNGRMYEGWSNVPDALNEESERRAHHSAPSARSGDARPATGRPTFSFQAPVSDEPMDSAVNQVRHLLAEKGYPSDYLNAKHAASRLGLYRKGATKKEIEQMLVDYMNK